MKIKIHSLAKFCSLTLLILQMAFYSNAQKTIIFSDNFSDNHNNWLLNGKRTQISKEGGYHIDNTSKEDFISLQTIPLLTTKDYIIEFTINAEWMDDDKYSIGEFGAGFRTCGVFFGAKDDKNGYSIAVTTKGVLEINKWTNGNVKSLFSDSHAFTESMFSEQRIKIVMENQRWKVLNGFDNEIANIAAQPFMGDKTGIYVEAKQNWHIRSLEITENTSSQNAQKLEFPTEQFIKRLSEISCEAKDKFKNSLGEPMINTHECYVYKNTVPGFQRAGVYTRTSDEIKLSEIGKEKQVELVAESIPFKELDEALSYFDMSKKAINNTKSDCSIPDMLNNDIVKKEVENEGFFDYQLWANFSSNPMKILLDVVSQGGTDGIHEKIYIVEFHCIYSY